MESRMKLITYLTVSLNLLPLIVVNSPGTATITNCPIWNICNGRMEGVQSVGKLKPP